MPTKPKNAGRTTARGLTARQRTCPHPPANVHPCYDDRWETCDLCHLIRPRPLPAPWIVAWDESQPAEQPPALFSSPFAEPVSVPVPKKRPRVTLRESSEPQTFAELRAIVRRDRAILGRAGPWQSPPLDEVYTPDQIATCHRCGGVGTITTQYVPGAVTGHRRNWEGNLQPTYATDTVPDQPRTCPRCQGAGRIPKYTA